MLKKISFAIIFSLILAVLAFGQTSLSLEEILTETEKQTGNYQETFRNLLALETKTFESYDKNEQPKKQSVVEADFLVVQSSKNPKLSFELRNVIKVDGKPIPNSRANSDQFFAELSKTSTLKSELEKINKTSSKYDKTFDVSGLTLYEGIILSNNLRPFFEFKLLGNETFNEQDVLVVGYQQIKSNPFISINGKGADLNNPSLEFEIDIPGGLKKNNIFLRGKFWIDAKTFQIWREERELTIQTAEPLVVLKTDFEYQPSKYEILVPKQITLLSNDIKKKDGKFTAVKDLKIIFDYSDFKRTETDVKILDDTD
jgi:hypothetical protein